MLYQGEVVRPLICVCKSLKQRKMNNPQFIQLHNGVSFKSDEYFSVSREDTMVTNDKKDVNICFLKKEESAVPPHN